MSKSLTEITRDLLIAKNEYEIFESDDLKERIDQLRDEQYKKKMESISFIKTLIKKLIYSLSKYLKRNAMLSFLRTNKRE